MDLTFQENCKMHPERVIDGTQNQFGLAHHAFVSVSVIFILSDSKKVADLIRRRTLATFYYYDDKPKTFVYPNVQYRSIITTIMTDMGQTINHYCYVI